MIEVIKNKISNRDFRVNSLLVAGTTAVGGVLAHEKNKLNKMDLDLVLTKEYGKYQDIIKNNIINIKDHVKLEEENKIAKNIFNEKCQTGYKILKQTSKKNMILGIVIGVAVGLLGVIIKSKLLNKERQNENNSSKQRNLNLQA